jgi:Domain of unknown function (DUF4833)
LGRRRLGAARTLIAGGALGATFIASTAPAEPLHFGPHDVTLLFTISKSENKNEVVYAVHLDESCAPVGDAPVFAFWRMLEKGPAVIEPLLDREQRAYGIASEQVLARGSDGGSVDIVLRAIPDRHIVVKTRTRNKICQAWSTLSIGGTDAHLYNVFVKLKLLGVDYILLSGWAVDGTHVVHETIEH